MSTTPSASPEAEIRALSVHEHVSVPVHTEPPFAGAFHLQP